MPQEEEKIEETESSTKEREYRSEDDAFKDMEETVPESSQVEENEDDDEEIEGGTKEKRK